MAFLGELIGLLVEGGEVAGEAAEIAEVTGETAEIAGETAEVAGETAEIAGETAEVAGGTAEAGGVASRGLWTSAKTFGKWAAKEAAKGALMYAGFKAAEVVMHKEAADKPTPQNKAALALASKITKGFSKLEATMHDWNDWTTKNFNNKNSYGTIRVGPLPMSRFQVFNMNLSNLSNTRQNKVGPLLIAANKSHKVEDFNTLKTAVVEFAKEMQKVSKDIKDNNTSMVNAGLADHQADIDAALEELA